MILFNASLLGMWVWHSPGALRLVLLGGSLILLGLPLLLLIELYNNPRAITKVNDSFAKYHYLFEKWILPLRVRKEILALLGDIKGKTVLEFGCNVGTLTQHLAENAGKIYATNISINQLRITEKRLEKKRRKAPNVLSAVELIYDIEHTRRVHPSVGFVDAAVSVGMLSYVEDAKRVLEELSSIMPDRGRIVFVEYVNFFHIIPDAEWLCSEPRLKLLFNEAGFSVHIRKGRGLFWNYLFVYGLKSEEEVLII
jgi:SAM-dependent methyltransferase